MSAPTSTPTRPGAPTPPTIDVDPRFRQRRVQVRKQAGRRRLHNLVVIASVFGVVLAAIGVVYSPVLDIDDIAVNATTNVDAQTVLTTAGIESGEPILFADLGGAVDRLEALPWVDTATVERSLPGSVSIAVTERVPAAMVAQGDTTVLVDATGRVLGLEETGVTPLGLTAVVLDGDAADLVPGTMVDDRLRAAITLAGRLQENPAGAVAAVVLDPDLHLELVEGGTVLMGDEVDLDQKIEDFRTIYARVDRACLETIDVRVPGRSVLTRSEPCS